MLTELPIIEIDFDVVHRLDEEKCSTCDKRFRCWTSRDGLFLDIQNFAITRSLVDWANKDSFEIEATILDCVELKNMVGKEIKIIMGQTLAIGVVQALITHSEVNQPTQITIKGICTV